ncbi:MAG: DUF2391 family protein [Candidatus Nanohaloarchaea archaeon]
MVQNRYRIADTAQQIVGGFLLAGPFVVTEEVWQLAAGMSVLQTLAAVGVILAIGYGALYRADRGRDVADEKSEPSFIGVPVRYISLVVVSYTAVTVLALVFGAPETFGAGIATTFRAITIATIFAVIGAATADSLF